MYKSLSFFKASVRGLRGTDRVIKGRDEILKLHPVLAAFCAQCGQDGRMDDLPYFFAKPGIMDSEPVLFLLLKKSVKDIDELAPEDLAAAALLYEYRFFGLGLRALAVVDRAGGALIAPPRDRVRMAARMREVLMGSGVHIAMLSVDATGHEDPSGDLTRDAFGKKSHSWKLRHRHYAAYLEMLPTMDETLATINQKTRFNLRYYRRRAEKDFGSHFLPEITISDADLIAFNKASSHPVSDAVLRWRLDGQRLLQNPALVGVKDNEGKWLSILAARRSGDRSEILWQMNRAHLPQHSIGTVMRSYFMENEIALGIRRMYVEQGTPHLMKNSFVHRDLYDIVLVRGSIRKVLEKLTKKYLPVDNPLSEILHDTTSEWHTPKPQPERQHERRATV